MSEIEDRLDHSRKVEKQTELPAYMQQAYNKAENIRNVERLRMDNFKDLYGDDNVTKDISTTFNMIRSFRRTLEQVFAKKVSDIFEIVMFRHIELSDWLGPNASTVLASAYDDVVNGVDIVTRFNTETGPRHLALAVDVTFGKINMNSKINRIQAELSKKRRACQVKYYEDEGQKGILKEVPRSVIGVSFQTVEQLSALWIDGNKKMLGNHPVQFMILKQLEKQLNIFTHYSRENNNMLLASKYKQAHNIVKEIEDKKYITLTISQREEIDKLIENDSVHQLLMQEVESFRKR